MAGDWIKMRTNLWDDPRVAKLCDMTDQSEAAIVGALYWLWSAADEHSEDGLMHGLTIRSIDRKTGVNGIGAALSDIGWIEDTPDGVVICRFEEHNGASAKKRAQTAKRVANFKSRSDEQSDETQETDNANAASVTEPLAERDLEKRREEKKEPTTTLSDARDPEISSPCAEPTRKGLVCGLLRKAGMADSAPHYLADEVWAQILSKRTDEEIVAVAQAKLAANPGKRIGLKYIAPALLDDPEPIVANARASPRMSHADKSKLAAARAIFGTEIEGSGNAEPGRIIDVTPIATRALRG